eukprot:15335337-Ditylum_brightwellii.AAC.1
MRVAPSSLLVHTPNIGASASEVILSKHPQPSQPPEEVLLDYIELSSFIDLDVMADTIEKVVIQM